MRASFELDVFSFERLFSIRFEELPCQCSAAFRPQLFGDNAWHWLAVEYATGRMLTYVVLFFNFSRALPSSTRCILGLILRDYCLSLRFLFSLLRSRVVGYLTAFLSSLFAFSRSDPFDRAAAVRVGPSRRQLQTRSSPLFWAESPKFLPSSFSPRLPLSRSRTPTSTITLKREQGLRAFKTVRRAGRDEVCFFSSGFYGLVFVFASRGTFSLT